ncbi:MAG: methionyl-tRNA formyltransferase [Bifidobacteriaceae bacterium]|nr:methionyl-tRNA formyltransferase [Aeriscardovia sp.]MEE1324615.1 methionyl-tRNA formyltransferase [Bifidobacteriaceae bacterium]
MRILFAGTPQAAVPSLEALAARNEVVAVLTRPDAVRGRGRNRTASPVKQAAKRLGIPVWEDDPRDPSFARKVATTNLDAAAVVAYGKILYQPVLDAVPGGWYNLHFSLLPLWRGAAPVQRAIWNGDAQTGLTVFRLTAGMDEGPILLQRTLPIEGEPTSGELMEQLAVSGARVLSEAFDRLGAGTAELRDQNGLDEVPADHARAAKITQDDAHIDFRLPSTVVSRRARACNPNPGAWCTVESAQLKAPVLLRVDRLSVADTQDPSFRSACTAAGVSAENAKAGQFVVSKKHVWVLCGGSDAGNDVDAVELLRVTAQGKKTMSGADWGRGARLGSQARGV